MRFVVRTQDESWKDISEKEMIKITNELEEDGIEFELEEYEEEDAAEVDYDGDFVRYMYYRDRV